MHEYLTNAEYMAVHGHSRESPRDIFTKSLEKQYNLFLAKVLDCMRLGLNSCGIHSTCESEIEFAAKKFTERGLKVVQLPSTYKGEMRDLSPGCPNYDSVWEYHLRIEWKQPDEAPPLQKPVPIGTSAFHIERPKGWTRGKVRAAASAANRMG